MICGPHFFPHAPQLKFNLLPCSASEEKACSSRAVLAWLASKEVHISRVLDLVCGRYLGVVRMASSPEAESLQPNPTWHVQMSPGFVAKVKTTSAGSRPHRPNPQTRRKKNKNKKKREEQKGGKQKEENKDAPRGACSGRLKVGPAPWNSSASE